MQTTRESSVLRSLAVAFGDGLAFGVGMKLSQRAVNPSGSAPSSPRRDLAVLMERVAEVEKRVAESGRGATRAISAGSPQFDQKVLEAVVAALDARLNEQAGHTESRITQLEARLAIELKSLHQQGDSAGAAETRMDELRAHFEGQIAALGRQVEEDRQAQTPERLLRELEDRLNVEQQSLHRRDQSLEALVEKRVDELSANVDIQIAELRHQAEEDRQTQSAERLLREFEDRLAIELESLRGHDQSLEALIQRRIDELTSNFDIQITAVRRQADEDRRAIRGEMIAIHREFAEEAAMAVERRIEEVVGRHAAALRAELEHRDDEIAELREVIFGFAQACRALTERPAPRGRQQLDPEPSNVQMLPDRRAV